MQVRAAGHEAASPAYRADHLEMACHMDMRVDHGVAKCAPPPLRTQHALSASLNLNESLLPCHRAVEARADLRSRP